MSYIRRKSFYRTSVIVLIGILFALIMLSITWGTIKIPVSDTVRIIGSKLRVLGIKADIKEIKKSNIFIVLNIRLPRVLLACLVGSILSLVGTSYQAIFKNPMADPYVMGASSGAAFGATIAIVLGLNKGLWGIGFISILAFIGALAATVTVYNLAKIGTKVVTTSILLAGIVMSSLLTACISIMMIFNHDKLENIVFWTMGSFNGASWKEIMIIIIPATVGMIALSSLSKEMNAILMGEEDAQNLGVNVERMKKMILVISSLLASLAVAVSGIIGFVGLMVPHLFRMIFGPDHRVLLPVSVVGGGIFLLVCDTLARSAIHGTEIPVGIITALFGGPFFLYLLKKSKGNKLV